MATPALACGRSVAAWRWTGSASMREQPGHGVGGLGAVAGEQDDEFVAGQACGVSVGGDGSAEPGGHDGEQVVTDGVAVGVVDGFEVVEVEQDEDGGCAGGEPGVDLGDQRPAVGQSGQRVAVGDRACQR